MERQEWARKRSKYRGRYHRCRKRVHGQPKRGRGCCRPIIRVAVVERIRSHRMEKKWLRWLQEGIDPLDVEL